MSDKLVIYTLSGLTLTPLNSRRFLLWTFVVQKLLVFGTSTADIPGVVWLNRKKLEELQVVLDSARFVLPFKLSFIFLSSSSKKL